MNIEILKARALSRFEERFSCLSLPVRADDPELLSLEREYYEAIVHLDAVAELMASEGRRRSTGRPQLKGVFNR